LNIVSHFRILEVTYVDKQTYQTYRQTVPRESWKKKFHPVVFSDSKGKYLEKKVTDKHEREIKWWIKSGETTNEGYSWLQNKLKSMI
jgi:hypothetical protein